MPTKQTNKSSTKQTMTKKIKSTLKSRLPKNFAQTAQSAAQTAAQSVVQTVTHGAKIGLDQALLALEHRGIKIRETQELAQERAQEIAEKIGRKILERAEKIRAEIADKPFSPAWLKEVTLAPQAAQSEVQEPEIHVAETSASAASSLTETTVSAPAEDMQPAAEGHAAQSTPKRVKKSKRPSVSSTTH